MKVLKRLLESYMIEITCILPFCFAFKFPRMFSPFLPLVFALFVFGFIFSFLLLLYASVFRADLLPKKTIGFFPYFAILFFSQYIFQKDIQIPLFLENIAEYFTIASLGIIAYTQLDRSKICTKSIYIKRIIKNARISLLFSCVFLCFAALLKMFCYDGSSQFIKIIVSLIINELVLISVICLFYSVCILLIQEFMNKKSP